ncbi:MAG: serine/threonine-protein kinase [Polyangiaceae bacterium]
MPRRIGGRVVLKLVARGGMGDVYLAATTGIEGTERPCIVKTVRRDHVHDDSFLARFLDEARVQAQLQHPGVAHVLDAATDDHGEPYTVVEYVEGRPLSDVRQRALVAGVRLSWADAVAIAVEIAQALAHVHERCGHDGEPLGIVHRDLSPQNVMVGFEGEVKVIDFGTARGQNRRCHTVAGVVFAKPGYVAPEVARQQVGDGRIDLYALGVILWELCAGRRFLSGDPQQHLDDVAAGKVVMPPVAVACGAPIELDEVIAKLTKSDPDDRYARASLAVPALARLLACAPSSEPCERGVRARTAALMRKLWPHEPGRTRSEFARLLRDAREAMGGDPPPTEPLEAVGRAAAVTSPSGDVDPSRLAGTPYRLVREIGQGSGGVVWEAEHVELGRLVALKVFAAEHASSQLSFDRFRCQARAMAGLSHPNLVEVLDFGRSNDGQVFLAMELVAGETLDAKLRAGAIDSAETTRVAIEVCRALTAAHAGGLIHRDIKPQNLILTAGGAVKLLDFGIAVDVGGAGPEGQAASPKELALRGFAAFGTPEYMAPEQVRGAAIDARADVYALGCVLYEMLVGAPPFDGSPVVVMGKQIRDTPTPPCLRAPERTIPSALEAVVLRAIAKDPEQRFASAAAMCTALEEARAIPEGRRPRVQRAARPPLQPMGGPPTQRLAGVADRVAGGRRRAGILFALLAVTAAVTSILAMAASAGAPWCPRWPIRPPPPESSASAAVPGAGPLTATPNAPEAPSAALPQVERPERPSASHPGLMRRNHSHLRIGLSLAARPL